MRKIGLILKVFVKHWYRRKSTVFWTILFPIIMISLFGSIFSNSGSSMMTLYVQNFDVENGKATRLSQALIDSLNQTNALDIHYVQPNQYLTEALKGVSSPRALIIQEGFNKELQEVLANQSRNTPKIILKRDASQLIDPALGLINTVIREFSVYLQVGSTKSIITLQEEADQKGFRYIDFFLPGVIGMNVMTTGIFGAVSLNTEYRSNGVLKKLSTTPISKFEWIVAVQLYQMIISFISVAIIIGIGYLPLSMFSVKTTLNLMAIIMIFGGTLVFSGIGMIIAKYVRDPSTADAAANAITFPMMFLSGTFFQIEMYPDFLKSVSQILPLTYFNNGLRAAMVDNQPDIAFANTAILFAFAVAAISVGVLLTNWRDN